MKAVVVYEYGGPEVLKFEERPDPIAGAGEVLVRVIATSINPIDLMRRSGAARDMFPILFPGVLGADLSGTIIALGAGVEGFTIGDPVFGVSGQTYAELCVAKAADIARIPSGLDTVEAAALPLVTTTGNQLIALGTEVKAGQTVFIAGGAGNVGRSAVNTAKARGAIVIAGVRKSQLTDAATLGADQVIATDDEDAMADLALMDAVADTVGGKTAEFLIAKVKPGGIFASVLGPPSNAGDYPDIKVAPVQEHPDPKTLLFMAHAVIEGSLTIPIGLKIPLQDAGKGHAAVADGGIGKVLLVADPALP